MTLAYKHSFAAIGTEWLIETAAPLSLELQNTIERTIERFDRTYSRFRGDSDVTRLKRGPGQLKLDGNEAALFAFYRSLYDQTAGKVTPLIGDMLERAGYDADYSFLSRPQKSLPSWDDALSLSADTLTTKRAVTIDIGAAGKGFLVDQIAEVVITAGHHEYVIDASGDIRHSGTSENRVGLEDPTHPGKIIGVIDVQNKSLCASATNRRAWGEGMHHVFDPEAKAPVVDIIATWVMAEDTMTADGIATALFFSLSESLASVADFEFLVLHTDGRVQCSRLFKDALFTKD